MDRDGKGANPREQRERCDRGECSQQRGNLKDDGYIPRGLVIALDTVKYTTLIKTLS
ncbi:MULTISPECIES: hypothetical protein [Photorhabdus]|uniref:hypothetical protein n=1 Tax=Photorhabdus TaxID=29487 RepID=UPI0013141096|nr:MULTISPECIES: hypothetical protein [Photorhabdus]NDL14782.1 hypothetical protein [Photorhabdus laumondii subsp. laumondii]NDL46587.1 hypothetical protein [Photorhabdus laumondii subsp. laumondii]NDL51243.1 hypothetical protein [Photorhabdus laumondii subsp. laumondii]